MRQEAIVIVLFSAFLLLTSGCLPEQGIDKNKFAELNRTVQGLKTDLTSSNPCNVSADALQRLDAGTTALQGKAASAAERDLIATYSHLLATFKDGVLLCQTRSLLSNFQFVPKGRIYVPQELDPLVEKYGLSTEKHLYEPTGLYWRSIAGDSINVIWGKARAQIKNIENMVNYN